MHEVSCFHLMLIACVIYGNIGVIESVSMLPVIDSMYCDSSAWLFRGVEMAWYQRASAIWSFRRWTNYYKRFRAAYTRWHAIWLCSRVFQLRATLSRLSTDYQRPRDRSVHEEEDTEMCNISMSTLWGPQLLLRQWKQPFFYTFCFDEACSLRCALPRGQNTRFCIYNTIFEKSLCYAISYTSGPTRSRGLLFRLDWKKTCPRHLLYDCSAQH